MTAGEPCARMAALLVRAGIVLLLVALLCINQMALVVADPGFSDPYAPPTIRYTILSHMALDMAALLLLPWCYRRRWYWMLAGTVAFAPVVVMLLAPWLGPLF